MNACRLFLIHPIFFFKIIFFMAQIIKRKEIEIHCRKFALKRSYINEFINLLIF